MNTMLRINLWFYLFAASTGIMLSCSDVGKTDEDPTPDKPIISLTVNESTSVEDFSANIGDTIVIEGTAIAGAIIKKFEGSVSYGVTNSSLVLFEGDSATKEFAIEPIKFGIPFTASGQSILFTFILTDLADENDVVLFDVSVNESPIMEVEELLLGGYGHATYGNLLNLQEDTVYFPNNVRVSETNQENVDLILSYDLDLGWILSATDDTEAPTVWNDNVNFNWPFTIRNSTRFQTLPDDFDFDAIQTSTQLEDVFSGEGTSSISSISVGQILAFQLDLGKQGKKGVLKVQSSTGGKANVRHINVAYKLQK